MRERAWRFVRQKMWVAFSTTSRVASVLVNSSREPPFFWTRSIVSAEAGVPVIAETPADETVMSESGPISLRKKASAMGLRQVLPVQTKRT